MLKDSAFIKGLLYFLLIGVVLLVLLSSLVFDSW